jgi:hypothetical protein
LPIFPAGEKSGLELGLAQAAGPLGNLVARQADRPKRASMARRESATWRGNLKRVLRSCRGLREKGSKQELPTSSPNLSPTSTYDMNLDFCTQIKGQSDETFIQFSILGSSDLKSQPHFFLF